MFCTVKYVSVFFFTQKSLRTDVLNQFKEVDLTKIKQINLLFNQSSQGCIRLADLSFVKEPQ